MSGTFLLYVYVAGFIGIALYLLFKKGMDDVIGLESDTPSGVFDVLDPENVIVLALWPLMAILLPLYCVIYLGFTFEKWRRRRKGVS